MTTLFNDTYSGPRYTYGLVYRPLGYAQVPDGWIVDSDRPSEDERYSFGTVDYPAPLPPEKIRSFQLFPLSERAVDCSECSVTLIGDEARRLLISGDKENYIGPICGSCAEKIGDEGDYITEWFEAEATATGEGD